MKELNGQTIEQFHPNPKKQFSKENCFTKRCRFYQLILALHCVFCFDKIASRKEAHRGNKVGWGV